VRLPEILTGNHEPVRQPVPESDISSTPAENADAAELSSIALLCCTGLCCTGLLISLIVVIIRMYGLL
jgi:hypothetical protein